MPGIEVEVELNWTYGVTGPDGRVRHIGPGLVTLPLEQALVFGGKMRVYRDYQAGKKYTDATLHTASESFLRELKRRGVDVPETRALPAQLTDIDGVGEEMAAALTKAGYKSVTDVAGADASELASKVPGVGPKTAPRYIAAAQRLSQSEGEASED